LSQRRLNKVRSRASADPPSEFQQKSFRSTQAAMLIPLPMGAAGQAGEVEVPAVVKKDYAKYWWLTFLLLIGVGVMDVLARDPFAVIFIGVMAAIVWYMASDGCRNMSQYCLFLFGMMCVIEAVIETIGLLMIIGGRTTHERTVQTSIDGGARTSTITVVERKHPLFDESQGFTYNMQSAVKIASPVVMLIAALVSYYTYQAYPASLFAQDAEAGGFYGGQQPGYGGYGSDRPSGPSSTGGTRIIGGQVVGGGGGAGRFAGNGGRSLFEGSGQRLGS